MIFELANCGFFLVIKVFYGKLVMGIYLGGVRLNRVDRTYRDKLRILLILYFFSEEIGADSEEVDDQYKKVFRSEVRIQKIDFLMRYPDYLSFELLELLEEDDSRINKEEIKEEIKSIFENNEPEIRRDDMLRYFFGAYEEIDHIIAFLVSTGFIVYKSKKNAAGREYDKIYYLTQNGIAKIENQILKHIDKTKWYGERCKLIKKYFGNLTGTELKVRQYTHEEYRLTPINEYIKGVQENVKNKYYSIYGEEI